MLLGSGCRGAPLVWFQDTLAARFWGGSLVGPVVVGSSTSAGGGWSSLDLNMGPQLVRSVLVQSFRTGPPSRHQPGESKASKIRGVTVTIVLLRGGAPHLFPCPSISVVRSMPRAPRYRREREREPVRPFLLLLAPEREREGAEQKEDLNVSAGMGSELLG